jgi:hypothetical protein
MVHLLFAYLLWSALVALCRHPNLETATARSSTKVLWETGRAEITAATAIPTKVNREVS